jgi:hypothetical protein
VRAATFCRPIVPLHPSIQSEMDFELIIGGTLPLNESAPIRILSSVYFNRNSAEVSLSRKALEKSTTQVEWSGGQYPFGIKGGHLRQGTCTRFAPGG